MLISRAGGGPQLPPVGAPSFTHCSAPGDLGNSIHMGDSFTLSSSKGCFVKAYLMLKDASGSLPFFKASFSSPGALGICLQTNRI